MSAEDDLTLRLFHGDISVSLVEAWLFEGHDDRTIECKPASFANALAVNIHQQALPLLSWDMDERGGSVRSDSAHDGTANENRKEGTYEENFPELSAPSRTPVAKTNAKNKVKRLCPTPASHAAVSPVFVHPPSENPTNLPMSQEEHVRLESRMLSSSPSPAASCKARVLSHHTSGEETDAGRNGSGRGAGSAGKDISANAEIALTTTRNVAGTAAAKEASTVAASTATAVAPATTNATATTASATSTSAAAETTTATTTTTPTSITATASASVCKDIPAISEADSLGLSQSFTAESSTKPITPSSSSSNQPLAASSSQSSSCSDLRPPSLSSTTPLMKDLKSLAPSAHPQASSRLPPCSSSCSHGLTDASCRGDRETTNSTTNSAGAVPSSVEGLMPAGALSSGGAVEAWKSPGDVDGCVTGVGASDPLLRGGTRALTGPLPGATSVSTHCTTSHADGLDRLGQVFGGVLRRKRLTRIPSELQFLVRLLSIPSKAQPSKLRPRRLRFPLCVFMRGEDAHRFAVTTLHSARALLPAFGRRIMRLLSDVSVISMYAPALVSFLRSTEEKMASESSQHAFSIDSGPLGGHFDSTPLGRTIRPPPDCRHDFSSGERHSLFVERQRVLDSFCQLQRTHSFDPAMPLRNPVEKLIKEINFEENMYWLASFFVERLLKACTFEETDPTIERIVNNPDKLQKLHHRFSSGGPVPSTAANTTPSTSSSTSSPITSISTDTTGVASGTGHNTNQLAKG
eukprot:Rmarinus@m.7991